MKISVIIPCLNEERFLPNLIIDLKNQTIKVDEILIIDAYSEDQTLKKVREDEVIRIIQTNPNIGEQRRLGGENATSDLLFFFDADVRLVPDFIEKSIKKIKKRKLDLGAFVYVPYSFKKGGGIGNSTFTISLSYGFINLVMFLFERLSPSGAGSGIFMTKELFNKTKGFRNDLKFDDIEFIRRASKIGKFRIIRNILLVSDRRFVRYGVLRTTISYLILSFFFLFNAFKKAEMVEYKFSDYKKKS